MSRWLISELSSARELDRELSTSSDTTLRMSVDQGKLRGRRRQSKSLRERDVLKPSGLGPTFRPPFVPVTLGTLVGRHVGHLYAPFRRTPLFTVQAAAGALFEDFGEWQRPAAFVRAESRAGEP